MSVYGDGLRLALGTLTAIGVPAPERVDRRRAAVAMTLAPVAVLPLAAAVAVVTYAGPALGLSPLVTGVLAIALLTAGNRAMHMDGLAPLATGVPAIAAPTTGDGPMHMDGPADTVDGLTASYGRERALEVMRASDVGPAGVVALVLVLLTQATALAAVAVRPYGWLLV